MQDSEKNRGPSAEAASAGASSRPAPGGTGAAPDPRRIVDRLDASPTRPPATGKRASAVELRVGIVLWPGFPLLSLAGLCDGLRHAADLGDQSRQMRCTWDVVGHTGEAVKASCGIRVPVDRSLSQPGAYDYVAVIGGLLPQIADAPPHYAPFLAATAASGVPLIGICTGSFVLARLGLLNGHVPCIHPFHVPDWETLYAAATGTTSSGAKSAAETGFEIK